MSYASVAASGPQQSDEEASRMRAPAIPEVQHTDDEVHSLVDVDSPHISSVPSDYESQSVKTDTQAERERLEEEARERADSLAKDAKLKKDKAAEKVKANSNNPVVLGNSVAIAALGGLLGFGAYRKYSAGELTWKVAGAWAGVVGLFAVGDYYVSQFLFKKYPPKK